jgi:hypothetical protein
VIVFHRNLKHDTFIKVDEIDVFHAADNINSLCSSDSGESDRYIVGSIGAISALMDQMDFVREHGSLMPGKTAPGGAVQLIKSGTDGKWVA